MCTAVCCANATVGDAISSNNWLWDYTDLILYEQLIHIMWSHFENDFALWGLHIKHSHDVSDFPLVSGVFRLLPVKLICTAVWYISYQIYAILLMVCFPPSE